MWQHPQLQDARYAQHYVPSSGSGSSYRNQQLEGSRPNQVARNPIAHARAWEQQIGSVIAASRVALARQLGVSRAHVTQVLSILILAPEA